MRKFLGLLVFAGAVQAQDTPLSVVQQLFDAVAHQDSVRAAALFTADASLYSVRADGTSGGLLATKWLERMAASKDQWLERIWNPKQLESGTVAHIWAEYDFHLAGKFHHCGIDSFSLLKTAAGWKIAAIADTRETTGCTPHPL